MSSADDLSVEDRRPENADFLLLGAGGFLGAAIQRALEDARHSVVVSRVRLNDRPGLDRLLHLCRPALGLVCAAGERGRPNVSWCDSHPVETLDANVTGQLNVAAACHAHAVHAVILGTGALYVSQRQSPSRAPFTESDAPNAQMNVYLALRVKLEELLCYFDNVLTLRVLYPVSSDLDKRGLIGKLARFEQVDGTETSATVLEDLCPLIPDLVRRRATGVMNFVNRGTVSYAEIVSELSKRMPAGWRQPSIVVPSGDSRPACELDVARLTAGCGREVPSAAAAVRRIVAGLDEGELAELMREQGRASAL